MAEGTRLAHRLTFVIVLLPGLTARVEAHQNAPNAELGSGGSAPHVVTRSEPRGVRIQKHAKKPDLAVAVPPWAAVDPKRADMSANDIPGTSPVAKSGTSRFDVDPDRIDYGMKAHGSNVSAGQTRDQNYNGNVTGVGGEVGLKLHF